MHAESEWYWGQFFDNVANSDYKEKAMNQLALYLGKWDLVGTVAPNEVLYSAFTLSCPLEAKFDLNNVTVLYVKIL